MLIYKIFRAGEWAELQARGQTAGAPIDVADGFVHFSTAAQCPTTAEPSRGGDLFPHLFAELRLSDVVWHAPLPWNGTAHDFPEMP